MKKIILGLGIVASCFAGDIKGGFGVELGGKYNNKIQIGKSETTGGEILYQIKAPKPIEMFNSYYVLITPKSKKIREIWGIGVFDESKKCSSNLKTLKIILEKKYGKFKKLGFSSDSFYLKKGNKEIVIKCDIGFPNTSLYLQYIDDKLDEKAEYEKAAIKAKTIENSL